MCNFKVLTINKWFWFSLGTYLLLSCSPKKESGTENYSSLPVSKPGLVSSKNGTTSINVVSAIADTGPYSALFSSIEYRFLTTPPGILVGEVRKLVEADNRFFLRSEGRVLIFDTTGKFLAKVDQQGKGPEQYRSLTDFIVDTVSHRIDVLDNYSFSVFTFDYTGKLINSWIHGLLAFKFQKITSDRYVFYTDKELVASYSGRFQIYDRRSKKVVNSFCYINKKRLKLEAFLDVNNFFVTPRNLLASCSGSDTIFSIGAAKIKPAYVFDFGKEGVPADAFDDKSQTEASFAEKRMKNEFTALYFVSFAESERYLIMQVVRGKTVFYLWLNKAKMQYQLVKYFTDDLVFEGQRISVSETFPTHFGPRHALRLLEPEAILMPLDSMKRAMSATDWQKLLHNNSGNYMNV